MGFKDVIKKIGQGALGVATGGITDRVFDLLDSRGLSPEAKAELTKVRAENEQELAKIEADAQARMFEAATEVIKVEAGSDDRFTRRWRPAFGYMCTALLFWNYAIVPLFKQDPVMFPDALFQLFGAYLLAAVGMRSWEKVSKLKDGNNHVA